MTSIDELPLDQVLSAVLPTYRALDVRSIAIGQGDQWHLGAVVIYATAEPVESVHDRQVRLLATQPAPQAEAFSLALEAIDASTLPAILEGLNKGRAPLQGHELELMEAEHRQDGRFSINLTTTGDWFARYQFAIRGPRPVEEILASSGLHPTALGLSSWRALNSWLGCPFFGQDGKSALQGLLVLPIYAALDPNPTLRANRIILHGRAHGRLQPDLMIAGEVLSPSGDIKGTPRPVIPAPEHPDGLNAFELAVDLDPYGFTMNESTRFQLLHKQLHALGYPASVTHNYLHAGNLDPLRQAARLFTAREWLPTYLLDQRPFKQPTSLAGFEIAVVWLLELLRIRTFPLFLSTEAEKLMSGGVEAGAADIIAFDAAFGLYLVDCTRTIPKSEKGARLRETARIVSGQLGIPVGSAIVAPVGLDMLRATWSTYGVALVDRTDLERLNDLIESGNVEVAREHLRQRLTNLPTVGDI